MKPMAFHPVLRRALWLLAAFAAASCSGESAAPRVGASASATTSGTGGSASASASASASVSVPGRPPVTAASSAFVQVTQEVPSAFHGEWNARLADCGTGRNDSRLRIEARRLRFYESEGVVTRVEMRQPLEILVTLQLSAEGQQHPSTRRLRLSVDGSRLQDVTDGPSGLLRLRCPK